MQSFYLRFVLQFVFIIHCIFHLTISNDLSPRNQCRSSWHYLSYESTCILFTTSQVGDVSWYDGYKACQTSSAQFLTLLDSNKFQSVQKLFNELKYHNQLYLDLIQRGAWIGKAEWSKDDLCNGRSTPIEDLHFNCTILTIRSEDQSLCLERVSCGENHPFICQNAAVTKSELVESTMERVAWWKCIIPVWCITESIIDANKPKPDSSAVVAHANLQIYLSQFEFDIPEELLTSGDAQALMSSSSKEKMTIKDWLFVIGGGFITLLILCMCCTACICAVKMIKNRKSQRNSANRHGSFESTYSAESR